MFVYGKSIFLAMFLQLFNSCYHIVGRSSEVYLSIFEDIRMENIQDNNISYSVAVQLIDQSKTSTYQELCIYPEIYFILCDWYRSMAYTCVMDRTNKNFVFPEFYGTLLESGESRMYYKVPQILREVYKHLYSIVLTGE